MTDLPASTGVSAFTARARRIHLVGFELPCRIGLHAFELDGPQTVRFDITLDIDPGLVPQDDRLDSVVDYDYLRLDIQTLVADRHFNLQETLVEEVAAIALKPEAVRKVRVRSSKPDVYPDCEAVSYELEAEKTATG